jgi:hypothetical protein
MAKVPLIPDWMREPDPDPERSMEPFEINGVLCIPQPPPQTPEEWDLIVEALVEDWNGLTTSIEELEREMEVRAKRLERKRRRAAERIRARARQLQTSQTSPPPPQPQEAQH